MIEKFLDLFRIDKEKDDLGFHRHFIIAMVFAVTLVVIFLAKEML